METEEDDKSNPSLLQNDTRTKLPTIETDITEGLLYVESHCGPHPLAELPQPELGGGDGDLRPPPPSEIDVKVPDNNEYQDVVAGENMSGEEASKLEVSGGGCESQSPPLRSPQIVLKGGDDESQSAKTEEESCQAEDEIEGIHASGIPQEVPGKEEVGGDLVPGQGAQLAVNNSDLLSNKGDDGDINVQVENSSGVVGAGVDMQEVNNETETKMEVVAEVADDSGISADVTVKRTATDGEMVKRDLAEETTEAADTAEEAVMADMTEDTVKVEEEKEEMPDISEDTAEVEEVKEEKEEETEEVKEEKQDGTEEVKEEEVLAEEKEDETEEVKEEEVVLAEGKEDGTEEVKEEEVVLAEEKEDETEEVKEEEVVLAEEMNMAEHTEVTDGGKEKETNTAEETEDIICEVGEMNETEMANRSEEKDNEEETDAANVGEEVEIAEADNAEDMELADGTEGAGDEVEEVSRSTGGKRKREKTAKAPTRASSRKKVEEDVCFICFDGGDLVLCDRRGCPKAYHASCVNRDDAFFRAKGRWNCGWHLCSICEKNAHYMCYTCTFSLCKNCIKDAVILCVRGNKGFCQACMKTIMMIERNEQGSKEMAQVDFDDKNSWEYLFKDYYIDLKEKLSLTLDELSEAKNPSKASELYAGKRETTDELYDAHNDGGSGSDSSGNAELTTSKRRKSKKRLRSHVKGRDSTSMTTVNKAEEASTDENLEWASKELLEFVMHMKNGDKSVCSQFDVQALLLEYIKTNKLRDPRRKSQIICDSRLEKLFGKPRVGHFEMLKLLESHFLLKEDSQADDLQGSVVDTETNQLETDGNSDGLVKANKDKRRRSRKKSDRRGLQSNVDDYAAIDMHNINLIYLRRSLLESLIDDTETFHDKVVGSFVRIRISGNAQKQDLYRLVQVVGTNKAAEPYRVGKRTTDFLLEILNLNKMELVTVDIISNQEFTEDECKRLRQSIKCGFINRLTVGDIQERAIGLQAVRVEDSLEAEITRLSHLRDRASDMGRRKELRECVEKLQLLKSPEERQHRLEEIPEIHSDPNMDPSYESEEDEGETDDKRQEQYLRLGGSSFNRRGREPISPGRGSFSSNDSWGGTRNYSSTNREVGRNLSNKGFSTRGDDVAGEILNEKLWGQERDRETQQSQSWEKPKSAINFENRSAHSVLPSESVPNVKQDIQMTPSSSGAAQSAIKINETAKIWHYKDPSGKIQGPFSMVQLRKWNNTGYFPTGLRIWQTTEKQDDSILLTDALEGNFQRDPQLVDNSSLKGQLVHSPHLASLYSTSAREGWKAQSEISNSTNRAVPAPVEVPKYSTDKWGSETNLPSPTPVQVTPSGTKGQPYENEWFPTPAQPAGSLSVGNVELQPPVVIVPESGELSHSNPSSISTKLLHSANSPSVHPQSTLPGESVRIQVTSHVLPALDSSGASVNTVSDMKSLQDMVQPVTGNNPVAGKHGWGAVSGSKLEVGASHTMPGGGSQIWGNAPSQKLEQNNSISRATQPSTFTNWSDMPASVQNSALSYIAGNPTGVSPAPGTSGLVPSDLWRGSMPAQQNIQLSAPSNVSRGMSITDNQTAPPRQGPESQNSGWGPIPGNPNMGWGGPVPANSNQGWVASGQGPSPTNANPGWVAHGQAPGNANPGWVASVQGQPPGNAFSGWVPLPGQGPAPVNANPAWVAPSQGPPPGNANPSWTAPPGNMGTWVSEKNHSGDRFSGQRDSVTHGGDSGHGGFKPCNRQSSFIRERDSSSFGRERDSSLFGRERDSSRPPYKGQRVCKYHESGHCKKGAACDYLHT